MSSAVRTETGFLVAVSFVQAEAIEDAVRAMRDRFIGEVPAVFEELGRALWAAEDSPVRLLPGAPTPANVPEDAESAEGLAGRSAEDEAAVGEVLQELRDEGLVRGVFLGRLREYMASQAERHAREHGEWLRLYGQRFVTDRAWWQRRWVQRMAEELAESGGRG